MAFDSVRLPEQVERGSKSIPRFQTTITTLGRGAEQRNADWSQQRLRFEISYGIQHEEDYDEVRDFFYARMGRARGFLFKDWSDYKAVNEQIGTGDGVKSSFQLIKNYVSSVTYVRTILAPVTGTVTVRVNGSPISATINYTTGMVTILGPAPVLGAVITADFEFDVPVRFDTDEFPMSVHLWNAASIESLAIVELPTRT